MIYDTIFTYFGLHKNDFPTELRKWSWEERFIVIATWLILLQVIDLFMSHMGHYQQQEV